MIEILSNFYLKNENEESNIPMMSTTKHFKLKLQNVEEQVDQVVEAYKQMHTVVLTYFNKNDLKYFLSIFTYRYANIKHRGEFEDVLVMNRCILL